MRSRFEHYWLDVGSSTRLTWAGGVSLLVHILLAVLIFVNAQRALTLPSTYQIRFIPYPKGEPQKDANVGEKEAKKVGPQNVTPPKPEPKPEPKPKPKPEPKPEAKAKPEPQKKPAAKEVKDSKSSDKKTGEKVAARPSPKSARDASPGSKAGDRNGNDAYMNENAPMKAGINLPEGTPTVLDGWARLVQMKVEKNWQIPAGLQLDGADKEAVVSFFVDRNGNLIGQPEIMKESSEPELAKSGVQAILLAAPLPPLPQDFPALEQQVIYVFSLAE